MSPTAHFIRVCAIAAAACFVALAVTSKLWIEPDGMVVFDSRLTGYSDADARLFLETITQAQTQTYLGLFRWLDTVFPILLTISLIGTIWLNTAGERPVMRGLALLGPAAYLAMDLSENALVARVLLQRWDPVSDAMILRASTYTQAKWMCLALSVLVVFWAWKFATKERVV